MKTEAEIMRNYRQKELRLAKSAIPGLKPNVENKRWFFLFEALFWRVRRFNIRCEELGITEREMTEYEKEYKRRGGDIEELKARLSLSPGK